MLFYHLCVPAAKYRTVVVQMLCKNEMKWKFGYACRQFSSTSASHICNKLPDCSKLVCGGLSNHAIFTCSNHSKKARLRTGRVPFDQCILTVTPCALNGSCRSFHRQRQSARKSKVMVWKKVTRSLHHKGKVGQERNSQACFTDPD